MFIVRSDAISFIPNSFLLHLFFIIIVGRTGRCQQSGTAYTYFTSGDCRQSRALVGVLRETGQNPPAKLSEMARNNNNNSGK